MPLLVPMFSDNEYPVFIQGFNFANMNLQSLIGGRFRMDQCILDGADLSELSLTSVCFQNCSMKGAILRGVRLDEVKFYDCDLTGVILDPHAYDPVTRESLLTGNNILDPGTELYIRALGATTVELFEDEEGEE